MEFGSAAYRRYNNEDAGKGNHLQNEEYPLPPSVSPLEILMEGGGILSVTLFLVVAYLNQNQPF